MDKVKITKKQKEFVDEMNIEHGCNAFKAYMELDIEQCTPLDIFPNNWVSLIFNGWYIVVDTYKKDNSTKINNKEKLITISAIDDVLLNEMGIKNTFTKSERDEISQEIYNSFNTSSNKYIAESMSNLARKLYNELFEFKKI